MKAAQQRFEDQKKARLHRYEITQIVRVVWPMKRAKDFQFNRAARLDFPNVFGPNAWNYDHKTIDF